MKPVEGGKEVLVKLDPMCCETDMGERSSDIIATPLGVLQH